MIDKDRDADVRPSRLAVELGLTEAEARELRRQVDYDEGWVICRSAKSMEEIKSKEKCELCGKKLDGNIVETRLYGHDGKFYPVHEQCWIDRQWKKG